MNHPTTAALTLAIVLLCWVQTGCRRGGPDAATEAASLGESQQIVLTILEDLQAMARFAAGDTARRSTDPVRVREGELTEWGKPDFRVRLPGGRAGRPVTLTLPMEQPIWEPAVYDTALARCCRTSAWLR